MINQMLKIMNKIICFTIISIFVFVSASCHPKGNVMVIAEQISPREKYAVDKLASALIAQKYQVQFSDSQVDKNNGFQIIAGTIKSSILSKFVNNNLSLVSLKKEGFSIQSLGKTIYLTGADQSGVLYACLKLADLINSNGKIPDKIEMIEQPDMVMRGTCIGLQKTNYLPGRSVYEYPYTPESFPWFYDKTLWVKYLDMMVESRYNSLYLWNGHPFASLVKLKDYPYAVEVDEETFKKNEEMFDFLTREADKRGIYVIQMFYNIIVSKPFAEYNHLKTQDRRRPIIPIISDYTRKSIAAFIEKYPNVGLLIALGEAMNTIDDDVEWFTKTIIPGVKDGLNALGRTDEPPIVLRAHDTDAKRVMEAAMPIYKNLYTMAKYNGESLTTYEPRDTWVKIPKDLSKIGSLEIANVHILANLEPFRYGSPDFIQKCVKVMHDSLGTKGLHLYPQASYWDWPYSADKTEPRELEMDRDWMWYKSWGRYAWNPARDSTAEINYWTNELGNFYGCGDEGKDILAAYELTGEIAPKLLRTFGISDGNRQTLLLGMFMAQLVNPQKYNVYSNFWPSNGPLKEVLQVYAEKEWKGEKHVGETPPQIIDDVVKRGRLAVDAIDKASKKVRKNQEEFSRLKNDIYCYKEFADYFSENVKAAMLVLRYKYSNDVKDLEQALPHFEKRQEYYQKLVDLTKDSYLYANSMQTAQRRIPISGRGGMNKTWAELLPKYQVELDNFKRNLKMLESNGSRETIVNKNRVLEPADVIILNKEFKRFSLKPGQQVYSDNEAKIKGVAEELQKLSGIQFSDKGQKKNGTILKFKSDKPLKILVGYFNTNSYSVLRPPTLETNAQANDRGQADIKIANALLIPKLYPVNVYTYSYDAGENELNLGKGRVLVLGFINGDENIVIHDAEMTKSDNGPEVDWLFY